MFDFQEDHAAAFEKEAKRLGIWDDGPEGVKVTIAMINASPRSALAGDALALQVDQQRGEHEQHQEHRTDPQCEAMLQLERLRAHGL